MAVHNQAGAREPAREKKGSMQELKLRRLTELNARLREDLERPRVKDDQLYQNNKGFHGTGDLGSKKADVTLQYVICDMAIPTFPTSKSAILNLRMKKQLPTIRAYSSFDFFFNLSVIKAGILNVFLKNLSE
ncbi:hypothetical protein AOL_s00083g167 [Orbilia oligospora ATCC 24927]|uniref:Guanine nucleotide-binding protein subunit gamma n=1 Tax=Arthrobotrys oligospora (strain ATCC 24927 / CBS 115.81 / DSM 1491) TaxID=756982 RepID=G1XGN6_ARTOA|nr:hypothetical protein AOL_s00083g167 [Orbilia oligospora ATCC 24927]EGX47659.1 hypothetical protein AOL_s00083g167 [Orbilia oligospora ATCC 24927]